MKKTIQNHLLNEISNFWNAAIANDNIKGFSHFKNYGKWEDGELWDQLGLENIARFEVLKILSDTDSIESMLEWGVGGGANAVKFCGEVKEFYGVDISSASISECEIKIKAESKGTFNYWLARIPIDNPKMVYDYVPKVDFFLSTSVFQHFPNPEYGKRIASLAYSILKNDGIALIQIKYGEHKEYHSDYAKEAANFTLYPLSVFRDLMTQIGFKVLSVTLDTKTFYAYYYLQK